jgi:hypothetical protein
VVAGEERQHAPRRLVKDGTKTPAARLLVVRMPMRKVRRNLGPSLAVRRLVLARDGFSCVCCGTSIIGRRYSLLRRASQGPDTPENLITVLGWGTEDCCGRIYLFRVRADKAKGYRLAAGEDPANKPMVIVTEDGGALVWLTASGTYSTGPPPPRQQAATLRLLRAFFGILWAGEGKRHLVVLPPK